MKIAFDENLPMAMVRVFETFATEKQLKKLTGNFEIESAKSYTPAPDDRNFVRRSDVPWIERFAKAGGRIIISGNTDIINVPHERLALINAGVITLFFEPKWNQRGFFEKCAHLMLWWLVIAKKAKKAKRGSFWKFRTIGLLPMEASFDLFRTATLMNLNWSGEPKRSRDSARRISDRSSVLLSMIYSKPRSLQMPKTKLARDAEQTKRFIEAARAAGASEDETVFDANLKKIVKVKPKDVPDVDKPEASGQR